FDPKMIPADAKWVVHLDLDAARNTKIFAAVRDDFLASEDIRGKLDQIKTITGLSIPDGVDDVTVFGRGAGDDAGVVVLHGKIDRQTTINSLQNAQQFDTKNYRNHDVYTWLDTDKNQTMWGAFEDDSTVVIGHGEVNVESALDAMDAKTPTLKPDSPLAAGAKPQALLYVAAMDIPALRPDAAKSNPIISSIDSGWASISEAGDTIAVRAELRSASADAAGDVRLLLDGVRGLLGVSARRQNADPVAKAVAAADKSSTATQQDGSVMIDWPIPIARAKAIIQAVADKQAAKN
ncbi:MAG TPA: hypothetical protein VHY37_12175, partial [Tepidisphaeraceae bacterium]|nr:hypothetical protein [Tepidisphaeraceae bacterium]